MLDGDTNTQLGPGLFAPDLLPDAQDLTARTALSLSPASALTHP